MSNRTDEFTDHAIAETREISEDFYVEIDEHGNVVSMTIEHAKESGGLHELVYREIGKQSA